MKIMTLPSHKEDTEQDPNPARQIRKDSLDRCVREIARRQVLNGLYVSCGSNSSSYNSYSSNSNSINSSLYSRWILKIIETTVFVVVVKLENRAFRLGNHNVSCLARLRHKFAYKTAVF